MTVGVFQKNDRGGPFRKVLNYMRYVTVGIDAQVHEDQRASGLLQIADAQFFRDVSLKHYYEVSKQHYNRTDAGGSQSLTETK